MAVSRNEFNPDEKVRIPSDTWVSRTPVRSSYAEVTQVYNSDVKRGLFDKMSHDESCDNIEMYYILINTWLHLCHDLSAYGLYNYLVSSIRKQGLLCTIAQCDERSDLIIQELDPDKAFPAFREAWSDETALELYRAFHSEECNDPKAARMYLMLQLLRYPKRFSPNGLKGAKDAVWKKFTATQDKWKCILDTPVADYTKWAAWHDIPDRMIDTHKECVSHYNQRVNVKHRHVLNMIRRIIKEALGDYKFGGLEEMVRANEHVRAVAPTRYGIDDDGPYSVTETETYYTPDIKLSPGATQDTCSCSFCKAYTTEYFTNAYGTIPYGGSTAKVKNGIIYPLRVNKNYKTDRLIAPERVVVQALCYHEVAKMYEIFKKSRYSNMVDLDKKWHNGKLGQGQDRSRMLALLGSLNNSYDTIDWSSASDSIVKPLSYYVATPEIRKALDLFASRYVDEDGVMHRLNTTGTSGNSITFFWESVVIMAVTVAALRLGNAPEEVIAKVLVYGDDTIIPHGYAEIVRDVAKLLGLDMNPDKTCYAPSYYREACGGEYYKGIELSTLYFPRNLNVSDTARASIFNETPNRTTSVIALANRFAIEEHSPSCVGNTMHQFILAVIRSWYPLLELGGDVIGPKSHTSIKSICTSSKYHLKSPSDRKVVTKGIDVSDHALASEVGRKVRMIVATTVTVNERQWYKIPNKARKGGGISYIGDTLITYGIYTPEYAPSPWVRVRSPWVDTFETTVEKWDTPYEIRERLIDQMRKAYSKAAKCTTKRVLNRNLYKDVIVVEPSIKWNDKLDANTDYTVYNIGLSSSGYEREFVCHNDIIVRFETERPLVSKDTPSPDNAPGSWKEPVTRVKSQTINRRPKDKCLCTKLSEAARREWWEYYSYRKFLAEGPEYEDNLMRNLHVSRPRMPYDKAYGSTKVGLVNVYEYSNTYFGD